MGSVCSVQSSGEPALHGALILAAAEAELLGRESTLHTRQPRGSRFLPVRLFRETMARHRCSDLVGLGDTVTR